MMTDFSRRKFLAGAGGVTLAGCCGSSALGAQHVPRLGAICNFGKVEDIYHTSELHGPTAEALLAVRWIIQTVGVQPNFEVLGGTFRTGATAYAAIRESKRYIVYDVAKFTWNPGSPNWFEAGIIAHEIGHHLGGHTAGIGKKAWDKELEADRFAGFAMGRLGATLEQATRWGKILGEAGGSTHPGRDKRLAAATEGWDAARAMIAREGGSCRKGWIGKPLDIDGHTCRVAQTCNPQDPVKLACRDKKGDWIWR